MKKPIVIAAATMLSLALAAPVWAGQTAAIDQIGDRNVTIVVQKKGNTTVRSWTAPEKSSGHLSLSANKLPAYANIPTSKAKATGGFWNSCGNIASGPNMASVNQAGFWNRASISQSGSGNQASANQSGTNNRSRIVQQGSGHSAETTQTGNNNTAVIIQRC